MLVNIQIINRINYLCSALSLQWGSTGSYMQIIHLNLLYSSLGIVISSMYRVPIFSLSRDNASLAYFLVGNNITASPDFLLPLYPIFKL